jgi:hypothetical protein
MAQPVETELGRWTGENLSTQGYRLSEAERRQLWLGLRFPTGLCLALVVTALALESVVMLVALSGIGLVAGFARRHPFDYLWNHGLRHVLDAPPVPPNPRRRRHAFKLATVWLLAVALLFGAGQDTAALVLGGILLAVCGLVTVTNFCVPSTLLEWWEQRRAGSAVST